MLRIIVISGLLSLFSFPALANTEDLEKNLSPCIKEGVSQLRRPRRIRRVEVYSSYAHDDTRYYLARVIPDIEQGSWSLAISVKGDDCEFIGDDYVNDAGLLSGLPDEVTVPWAKRDIQERLKSVSRKQFLKDVKEYGGLQPYEYKAMRELGLVD